MSDETNPKIVMITREEGADLLELQRVRRLHRAAEESGDAQQRWAFAQELEALVNKEPPGAPITPPEGDTRGPKEFVYDTKINALMSEVIRICLQNNISFLFDAELDVAPGDAPDSPMHVTTASGEPACTASMLARAALDPRGPHVLLALLVALKGGPRATELMEKFAASIKEKG